MAIDWLIPWHSVERPDERAYLLKELQRELPEGHVLARMPVTAVGRRQDCDDVLFALGDGRVAVVHLTWLGKTERANHPWTTLFSSFEQFVADEMKPEHEAWK